MTTKQLTDKVSVRHAIGYNLYEVTIEYRGKKYTCKSNNSLAWDRIKDGDFISNLSKQGYYTLKGAYKAFYDECLIKNNLGKHNY